MQYHDEPKALWTPAVPSQSGNNHLLPVVRQDPFGLLIVVCNVAVRQSHRPVDGPWSKSAYQERDPSLGRPRADRLILALSPVGDDSFCQRAPQIRQGALHNRAAFVVIDAHARELACVGTTRKTQFEPTPRQQVDDN